MLRTHDVCVQRFMPDILARGELSFIFMGGTFSHAVRKTVGTQGGGFAHELLGGVNQRARPFKSAGMSLPVFSAR